MSITKQALDETIYKAITFLSEEQLDWGEFGCNANFLSDDNKFIYVSSPFMTTFIIHSLSNLKGDILLVDKIITKALKFIIKNKEGMFFRYYGKNSSLSFDLDTTACCYSSMIENNISFQKNIFEDLLQFRDSKQKLFQTWVELAPTSENDIDSVVNANILFFYCKANKEYLIPEVIDYLIHESDNLYFQSSQMWYYSPQIFAYSVSRAFKYCNIKYLIKARNKIVPYLLLGQNSAGDWGNPLETALAVNALINFGIKDNILRKAIEYLIEKFDSDEKCWQQDFFYIGSGDGAKSLTTAFCIEAISKYLTLLN